MSAKSDRHCSNSNQRVGGKGVMKTWLRLETREEVEGRAAFLRERQIEGMKFWNSCLSCLPSKQENLMFTGFMGNKAELEALCLAAPAGCIYMAAFSPSSSSCVHTKKVAGLPQTWVRLVKKNRLSRSTGPFWHSTSDPLDDRRTKAWALSGEEGLLATLCSWERQIAAACLFSWAVS